jgi:hypothetical protein
MSNQATQRYQEKNTELSKYIDKLSKAEQQLVEQISETKDATEQARLTNNLILIQDTRTDLINVLSSINKYYTQNLRGSSQTLEQQTDAVAIMDKEMEQAKKRLAYINEQKQNKLRVVEINQYYSASYAEWTRLIKILTITIIMFSIIITIQKYFTFLPGSVSYTLMFIISIISLYYIFVTIASIYSRDKMVYDEYNWNFNINSAPKMSTNTNFINPFKLPTITTCINANCCQDGTLWNDSIGKCVPEVSTTTGQCSATPISNPTTSPPLF